MILNTINNKKIPFKTVLMDSLYTKQRWIALIDNDRKIYYCPLKNNHLIDDIGGVENTKKFNNWIVIRLKNCQEK